MRYPRIRIQGGDVLANVGSRLVALVALALGTVVVARTGGASDVGTYALLRVLPGLTGVVAACGLPAATAYFLAGPTRAHPRLWPTLVAVTLAGGGLGAVAWLVASPMLHAVFFDTLGVGVVAAASVAVFTQLPLAVGKGCLQGLEDRRGTNLVIAYEELAFLPAFALAWWAGLRGPVLLLVALVVADVVVAAHAWVRVFRRAGRPRWVAAPDLLLASTICRYGVRGQVGGMLGLLNLRLDFVVLGAMAGPATVGTYAIASKYAELLKLPGLAVTWVMYPRVARLGAAAISARIRALVPRSVLLSVALAVPLAAAAAFVLPALYGSEFDSAVPPSYVLLAGLVLAGASGLATAYLYGDGRPGLNSVGMGLGLIITVVLDLLLIPRFGAMGAAAASAVSYLVTDIVLLTMFLRLSGRHVAVPGPQLEAPAGAR